MKVKRRGSDQVAYRTMDQPTYDKLVEGFKKFPAEGNYKKVASLAGVDWRTAKRFYTGEGTKPIDPWRPIRLVIADEEAARAEKRAKQEASLAEERERLAEEAEKARKLEEEAGMIDQAALRTLRKDTLAGLVACSALTDGITLLAKRIGQQLAAGVDAKGVPLDLDVGKTIRVMRDYSLTVGRLAQVVDVIASMERVKQGLPTAIMGIDIAHVTLEDAEREVAFAQEALGRARDLGLVIERADETDAKTKH